MVGMHRAGFKRGAAPGLAALFAVAALAGACGKPRLEAPAAGTYTVAGRITDAEGRGLSGAGVMLSGSPRGSLSDASGAFAVPGVYPDRYKVTVTYLGYRSEAAIVHVAGSESGSWTLAMRRDEGLTAGLGDRVPESMDPVELAVEIRPEP